VTVATLGLALLVAGAGHTGTTVFPFLKAGQGPRAAGMGEAYTSLALDASAVYWNPAGLGRLAGWHLAASHHQWFTGITDEVVHGAVKAGPGTLGFGLAYSGEGGIEWWDEENQPGDTFGTWDAMVSCGYGLKLAGQHLLGCALKFVTEDLRVEQGLGAGVDIGVLTRPLPRLSAGAAVRHLGAMWFGAGAEWLPSELAAGASYAAGDIVAALDVVVPLDNVPNVRLGLEYSPVEQLALRAGYRTGPQDLKMLGALSGLCAGLGFTVGNLGFDYSFTPYGELGAVHRAGLRLELGPAGRATTGSFSIRVLDADSRQPVEASLVLSGAVDTAATAAELTFRGVEPGDVVVSAVKSEYRPRQDTFRVVAGRRQSATLVLEKVKRGEARGTVYDAGTRQSLGGRIVYRGPAFGDEVVPASGAYRLRNLPAGEYRLGISGPSEEYLPQACTLVVAAGQTLQQDFYLARRRQTIVLEGVNFETGKADILPQFEPVLNRTGEILRNTPEIRVELAGHTDPREINTREFPSNWELSRARAEAVRQFLIARFGVAPERMTACGYADTQPIVPNDTEEGMARNRRTEFRIVEEQ
jgi:outer membrane protein OmpA-like peptidoglycan-associated protein